MNLTPEQYLALSSLAYENLQSQPLGDLEKSRIDKVTKNINTSRLELRALSSLSSWVLVNAYTSPSGMSAIAVQNPKTKEVVFVYRGTDAIEKNFTVGIKDWFMDLKIAVSLNLASAWSLKLPRIHSSVMATWRGRLKILAPMLFRTTRKASFIKLKLN